MQRPYYFDQIKANFRVNRIVALLGPRQCGKTTLAKQFCAESPSFSPENYFDLENPFDLQRLDQPALAFGSLTGLIVIDEVQRKPELFPILRYLHDEFPDKMYLILGSASRELIRQSSESLAGRISYLEITPFLGLETPNQLDPLWIKGGFPRSYLADTESNSFAWRHNYIKTYLEQDVPNLGFQVQPERLRKLWMLLTHYHGGFSNYAELASSLMLTGPTIKSYIDILSGTFMIRVLMPWFENINKRQVKTPKIYFRDSGIYHYFLGLENKGQLQMSPKIGASWEGFALEQVIQKMKADPLDCYFWATHNKAELDLMILSKGQKYGFEFKYQDAPKMTASMRIAMKELALDKLTVIYPGDINYHLDENIEVVGLKKFLTA